MSEFTELHELTDRETRRFEEALGSLHEEDLHYILLECEPVIEAGFRRGLRRCPIMWRGAALSCKDDVMQEARLVVVGKLKELMKFESPSKFLGYVHQVAYYTALRANHRLMRTQLVEQLSAIRQPQARPVDVTIMKKLHTAVDEIPDDKARFVMLLWLKKRSIMKTVRICKKAWGKASRNTIYRLRSIGRNFLRKRAELQELFEEL